MILKFGHEDEKLSADDAVDCIRDARSRYATTDERLLNLGMVVLRAKGE